LIAQLVQGERDAWKLLETTAGWAVVGVGGYFAIWIEGFARR
jgi:hypothetical protein